MTDEELLSRYQLLQQSKAYSWHADRTLLRIHGPDASKFLHNFCTSDVNALQPNQVTESFVLDSRGKTLSFGHILKFESEIFWAAAGKAHSKTLRDHFEKYIIREKVEVEELSMMTAIVPEQVAESDWNRCEMNGKSISAHADFCGPCRLIMAEKNNPEAFEEPFADKQELEIEDLTAWRLEHATPWYGSEVDESNLPQELRRDESAISFTKGCYLGQETVAKIDAIGHVNRFMVGLAIEGDDYSLQGVSEVLSEGKPIGEIRTVSWSPALQACLGVGFVKRKFADVGTELVVAERKAKVVALPVEKK